MAARGVASRLGLLRASACALLRALAVAITGFGQSPGLAAVSVVFPDLFNYTDPVLRNDAQLLLSWRESELLAEKWSMCNFPTWNPSVDMCTWLGISCLGSDAGQAAVYELSEGGLCDLNTKVPAAFKELQGLAVVGWASKELKGLLPESWSSIATLLQLDFSENMISGSLPEAWSNLAGLSSIDLSDNTLSGSLPDAWQDLRALREIRLGNNQLQGALPMGFSMLTALQQISMDGNHLGGSLPPQWSTLALLDHLELDENSFSSSLPPAYSCMSSLTVLVLSYNNIYSTLPPEWGQSLSNLYLMDLSHLPDLTGTIPSQWSGLTSLRFLNLDFSGVSCSSVDTMPSNIMSALGNGSDWLLACTPGNEDGTGGPRALELWHVLVICLVSAGLAVAIAMLGRVFWQRKQAVGGRPRSGAPYSARDVEAVKEGRISSAFDLSALKTGGSPASDSQERRSSNRKSLSSISPTFLLMKQQAMTTFSTAEGSKKSLDQRRSSYQQDIQILKLIGSGAAGKVFKARWKGVDVALKVIQVPASDGGMQSRKERLAAMESAISTYLRHPNVVHTYSYEVNALTVEGIEGEEMENAFTGDSLAEEPQICMYELKIVMELCTGGSLRSMLSAGRLHGQCEPGGLASLTVALSLAHDIACGMAHIHSCHIVHSDLKAGNILLSLNTGTEGVNVIAKVSDFGLAVTLPTNRTHLSGVHYGTVTHMAPETLLKGRLSPASDVYAFGILMYELITGKVPFKGKSAAELIRDVMANQRPVFPHTVPVKVVAVAVDCWQSEPELRPTFADLVVRLEQLIMLNSKGLLARSSVLSPSPSRTILAPLSGSQTTALAFTSEYDIRNLQLNGEGGDRDAAVHHMDNVLACV